MCSPGIFSKQKKKHVPCIYSEQIEWIFFGSTVHNSPFFAGESRIFMTWRSSISYHSQRWQFRTLLNFFDFFLLKSFEPKPVWIRNFLNKFLKPVRWRNSSLATYNFHCFKQSLSYFSPKFGHQLLCFQKAHSMFINVFSLVNDLGVFRMNWFNYEYEKLFCQNILKDLEKFKFHLSVLKRRKKKKSRSDD